MLTRKLIPENSDIVKSIAVLIEFLSLTSHSIAIAEPPLFFISSATDYVANEGRPTHRDPRHWKTGVRSGLKEASGGSQWQPAQGVIQHCFNTRRDEGRQEDGAVYKDDPGYHGID